jgi:hypothetical protein
MSRARAYYCLVQYCPDAFRAEAANVGVVLLCPERHFLDARLAAGADRPRRFFRGENVDRHALAAAKRSFQNAVERARDDVRNVEQLQAFLGRFGNALTFTVPRTATVEDPADELNRMFEELVGGRTRREGQAARRLPELEVVFERYRASTRVERDKRVVVPRIDVAIQVPYAYTNGRLNLVRPTRFSDVESTARRQAEALILEGNLIAAGMPDAPRQVVVSLHRRTDRDGAREAQIARLFTALEQTFVAGADVPQFAHQIDIELAAHVEPAI